MERESKNIDPHVAELVKQAEGILADPEEVYDLAGKRFALRCVELEPFLTSDTFRLGVVGNPNRGKTTYAHSCYQALKMYGFPTSYSDLDIYSVSGQAISGQVRWEERPKRPKPSPREVRESIKAHEKAGPGMVVGDFPGKVDDPYQRDRLKATDLAIVLGVNIADRRGWQELVTGSEVPALWLRSQLDRTLRYPLDPTIYALNREPKHTDLDVLTSLTKILEVVAEMRDVSLSDPWPFFTEAERVVLEEVLDFQFAPFA